uniref:Uncharacterized protein n=1 Tax=Arundo donax TaxID=35708 RepID=A0A0A9HUY7_ARUDO
MKTRTEGEDIEFLYRPWTHSLRSHRQPPREHDVARKLLIVESQPCSLSADGSQQLGKKQGH